MQAHVLGRPRPPRAHYSTTIPTLAGKGNPMVSTEKTIFFLLPSLAVNDTHTIADAPRKDTKEKVVYPLYLLLGTSKREREK